MEHLITISIMLVLLYIPYPISRYLIIKQKPDDIEDVMSFWIFGLFGLVLVILLILLFAIVYTEIYNNL